MREPSFGVNEPPCPGTAHGSRRIDLIGGLEMASVDYYSTRLEAQRLETAGRAGRQGGGDGARAGKDIPSETSNGSRKGKRNCHAIVFPNGTDTVANAKPESDARTHAFVWIAKDVSPVDDEFDD
ncbi:hypothetical protein CEP53_007501 [Fusarium sp. AF-6]|nr:hypothetical protein CEP53_007501 [Fusarium sp. AF-6]